MVERKDGGQKIEVAPKPETFDVWGLDEETHRQVTQRFDNLEKQTRRIALEMGVA